MKKEKKIKYLKIHNQGGSRVLAVSSFVPSTWYIVKVTKLGERNGKIFLMIEEAIPYAEFSEEREIDELARTNY